MFNKHSGKFEKRAWQRIRVGDVVKVEDNQDNKFVPADMLILHSEGIDGICYVETKNLDGETNLKLKQSPPELNDKYTSEEMILGLKGTMQF